MRKLIFILLAFMSLASYGQTKQTIKQLTVNDSLTIKAGNPAANKIATSIDGNGRFRWVYFSDFQDSINTGVFDTSNVNVLIANTVKVNRDSFTDPAASIASIGDSGFIVQCAATCEDIRWKTINGAQTVLKDSTDNVGIGTSNPLAKLDVRGSLNIDSAGVKLLFGKNKGVMLLDGLSYSQTTNVANGLRFDAGYSNDISSYLIELNLTNLGQTASVGMQDNGTLNLNGTTNINMGTEVFNLSIDGTQSDGYVLTSDASGNATWQDHTAYGEMGFGDSTRTLALTQNVFSVVTNSNKTLWQTAAIDLHNVTYSGDSLIIDSAGTYQVNVQLSMDGTSGSVIRLGVFLNGVLACSCTGYQELLNNRILQLTYINIDALNAGDVLQVVITNTANNDDVDAIGGKLMVNKIR
jgi:TusA-related sulfurtransferase